MAIKRACWGWLSVMAISIGVARGQSASTQPLASDETALAEIIVTAEKSRESLQDAAAAISVVSEADLTARGASDIRSLEAFVPSLKTNQEGTATQLFIRGVGKQYDQARLPDAVGMVVDGILIPQHSSALSLFDVQSVEVLPGPQGTLYGSSSIGGIVQVATNRPSPQGQTSLLLEAGDYALKHVTIVENDPINADWSVRAAFNGNYRHGYNNNGTFNDDSSSLRLSTLYSPTGGDLSLHLSALYSMDHFRQATAIYHPFPDGDGYTFPTYDVFSAFAYPPNGASNSAGDVNQQVAVVNGQLDWRLGNGINLTYTPGYLRQKNPGSDPFQNVYVVAGFFEYYRSNVNKYSNELRLSNEPSAKMHWIAGLYQESNQTEERYTFGPNLAGYDYLINIKSYAAFGQGTYSLSDTTNVTLGVRLSRDSLSTSNADLVFPILPDFSRGSVAYSFNDAWKRADWKVGAEHHLTPNSMLYATVQSGFNPGTFQGVFPTPEGEVHPQTMIGYTVGSKNLFFGSRLKVNLEGYLYDYKDQIVSIPYIQTGSTIFYNVPKSRSTGVQLDLAFKATSSTTLDAMIGYLHGTFRTFSAPSPITGGPVDYAGHQLDFAPNLTANLGLQQDFSLGDRGSIAARVDSYISSSYWIVFDNTPGLQQPHFTRTDASLTYRTPDERWEVGLWAKNLEDKAILATGGETGRPYPFAASTYVDPPRTYGIRFAAKLKH